MEWGGVGWAAEKERQEGIGGTRKREEKGAQTGGQEWVGWEGGRAERGATPAADWTPPRHLSAGGRSKASTNQRPVFRVGGWPEGGRRRRRRGGN